MSDERESAPESRPDFEHAERWYYAHTSTYLGWVLAPADDFAVVVDGPSLAVYFDADDPNVASSGHEWPTLEDDAASGLPHGLFVGALTRFSPAAARAKYAELTGAGGDGA